MKKMKLGVALVAAVLLLGTAGASVAQNIGQNQNLGLWLPNVSPGAVIGQTFGITDIKIVYHRPSVNERTIWGGIVPYGQVWRTGANENTLISFSTTVEIEGQELAAGTYGLHALPGESEWEIIFSKDTSAWGSFAYDDANDALRVKVTPEESAHQEQMAFTVDEVTNDSAVVSLHWEKLRVPVKVNANTNDLVLASVNRQLTGLAQFNWIGWNQAAGWCLNNDLNLDEGLQWADNSIQAERRFDNLSTKSQLLAKLGRNDESTETMSAALDMANPGQLHQYGRQLLGQEKKDEAMAIFERNAHENPETWFIGVGLARGHAAFGRFDKAAEAMKEALTQAPDNQKTYIQGLVTRLESGENI